MSVFSLLGFAGIYLRHVKEAALAGLVGFLFFSLCWVLSITFSFVEAFVLQRIATYAPQYVEVVMGLFGGAGSEVDLGALPILAAIAGVMYALGGYGRPDGARAYMTGI
jgi:hypothetical protein